MTFGRATLLILLLLAGTADAVHAQMRRITEGSRPALQAHHIQASVSIDGRLDEAAWQQAEAAADFQQFEPNEGTPASQRSAVRVLYDAGSVYIGAQLYDEQPARIQRTLGRRDVFNQADWFVVSIDSYFDQKTAYIFAVNAAGVQLDAIRTGPDRGPDRGMDASWDAIWASNVQVTEEGWIVEMRIPYSMLRFAEAESQTWGIHFARQMPRRGEEAEWPLVPRTERANLVAQYGLLQGLSGIAPRRNLQVSPYTVSRLHTEENPDLPGEIVRDGSLDVGGDLKIGIGSNVTLDATINPDFGQVESDPAELNLTAFETFFDERRPFFIEGIQIYEFGLGRGSDLLYTRRIGAQAPIVGAAKLSGRTANGLSFGVLGASTGEGFDPARNYGVARLIQQLGAFSSAGGIFTAADSPTDAGRRRSLAGGVDWDVRFLNNAYSLEGFATVTHRRWVGEDLDPETGLAATLRGAKRQGTWRYDLEANVFDDRFNPNDLGRLRRNNYVSLQGGIDYEVNGGQSFGPFQRAFIGLNSGQQWAYEDGTDLGMDLRLFSFWTFRGFQSLFLRASAERPFGGYDLYETRGLGPRAQPASYQVNATFRSDERRAWQVGPEVNLTFDGDGGRRYGLGLEGTWNVGSRLTLMADVQGRWEDGVTAWSSNETFARAGAGWQIGAENASPDNLGPEDYVSFDDRGLLDGLLAAVEPYDAEGRFYVPLFGVRDTRSVDFTLRSSITFTRNLSLQVYGQLFVARGRYDQFQILQDRDTLVPFGAFPKRDDFALSSFQANTVLRWEYRPGSTLYLVWSQGRRTDDQLNPLAPWGASPYATPMDEQIADTFRLIPSNVFLIKFSYTFLR